MEKLVEVPFEGGTILFEHRDPAGPQAHAGPGEVVVKAEQQLGAAFDMVKLIGEQMSARLRGLKFESAEAKFGIKFSGKGKLVVAEASAEASIEVKLVYKGG